MKLSEESRADEILERFKQYGVEPRDKYKTVYDAFIGLKDAADNRIAAIEAENKELRGLLKKASDRLIKGGDFLQKEALVEQLESANELNRIISLEVNEKDATIASLKTDIRKYTYD